MGRLIRDHDWSGNPLGPPENWSDPLRFALGTCLASTFPTAVYWGPELRLLYNDAWAPIPAERHPWALGRPGAEVWSDIWDVVGPQFARVMAEGTGFAAYDQLLMMERGGVPRETYWNYSFTPVRDESGRVAGILNQGNETTRFVLAERARRAEIDRLRDLFQQAPGAVALLHGPDHVFELANTAYQQLVGNRPLLGRTVAEALPEVVAQGFVDLLDQVFATGDAFVATARELILQRGESAAPEARVLDFVYQPIKDATGATTDIFVQATDVTERSRAEAALRLSEERLQLALDASTGIGTWEWSAATGRLTGDARFAKLFGVATDEAQAGTTFEAFLAAVHSEDRDAVSAAIATVMRERTPLAIEYRVVRADGAVRWLLTQGRCFFDDAGRPVRFPGVSFDITERKSAEEAARATAEELRVANEAQAFIYALAERQRKMDAPDAVMEHAATALGERMALDRVGFTRVVGGEAIHFGPCWTNGRLAPLTGTMPVAAVDNRTLYAAGRTAVMHDVAREAPGSNASRLAGAGIGVPITRGGQWIATFYISTAAPRRWSSEEVAFVEAVAELSWDAVERTQALQALRESEEKFRAIANSIDQMIWSTRPDGFHDYYNDRWYEYTGAPHGSTDGEGWNDMFHPADQERAWGLWRQSLETGEPYHIEYRLRHRSGAYRWVLGRAQPMRDDSGRITRWFGTCTDIQDIVDAREVLARSREELEREVNERTQRLMAAEERLRQAQKMEAVGQLTGGIAHDFNNMLAVVIGGLDLLERRIAQGQGDLDRYILAARDGATRAAALTQRLLAFSRQQPLTPVAIDANQMVQGMIELLVRTLGETVTVETALAAEVRPALADANQLENVILNLAVNARDAMPEGGTLTIATRNAALDETAAEALGLAPGDYVEIAVSDTGTGMAPETAARAFDPFFTTKGVGRGTGLGLSQVFGFIRQSGGHVAIETALGRGTTVRVHLPAHCGPLFPSAGDTPAGGTPGAKPGEVVMVVEDEERVRAYSCEALRDLGYGVIGARDGPEALRILDRGQRVSLLFTDVVMPDMTGNDLAARARERLPELRVLFTSGYTSETQVLAGAELLPKPFNIDQLARKVRATLDA